MYSKKINQLATNLNPQETDLIPIGDAETGQLKTTTFNQISGITGDGVISGGIVTWTGTGLVFNISACTYILNGVRYVSPFSTKTLAAADPTNPRIDVFAVNTSGQVEVIQGTPNANPVEPEGDTPTTLGLTNVTINAGATTPNGVTKDMIYDENVESWTKGQSVTGSFDYNNTAFAYTGSKSLLVTMNAGYAYFLFSKATAMDITTYKSLSFAIRLNAAWSSNTALFVQFYNSTNLITNTYQITATNNVGFNRNLANTWQLITIPLDGTILKFKQNSFTGVRIYTTNAAATYRLDTISLNGGISNPTGGGTSANSFGFVNGSTGSAASTQATDTLNIVGTGLATTSATGKTLTISVPQPTITLSGAVTGSGTSSITTTLANSIVGISNLSATGTPSATTYLRGDNTWATISGGGASIGDTVTGGTTGSVLFVGALSALAQDNTNFFWDDTNNRLGIGTNAPANDITLSKNQDAATIINISNSTSGASSVTQMRFTSDASSGVASVAKYSTGTNALKFLAAKDFYIYNASFGDIAILNNSSTGKIKIGAGGASTEQMTLTAAGRLLLGTTTESTFLLDVNGTSRVSGSLIVTGSTTAASAIARGANFTPTLVAAANNDVLVGLDVNPTFTNGAFTGVANIGTRIQSGGILIGTTAISTNTIAFPFQVNGTNSASGIIGVFRNSSSNGYASFRFYNDQNTGARALEMGYSGSAYSGSIISTGVAGESAYITTTGAYPLHLGSNNIARMIIFSNGNVAIGQNTSSFKLDVLGNIRQTGTITASSGVARGIYNTSTLVAAANNDILSAIEVNPFFTNGAFTGVENIGLYINFPSKTGINTIARFRTGVNNNAGQTIINMYNLASTMPQIVNIVAGNIDAQNPYFAIQNRNNAGTVNENFRIWENGSVTMQNGGTYTNVATAQLEVTSTTKGFLPPRMTTTQKNAIATPAAGLIVYDTDTNKLCCYNGTTWNDLF